MSNLWCYRIDIMRDVKNSDSFKDFKYFRGGQFIDYLQKGNEEKENYYLYHIYDDETGERFICNADELVDLESYINHDSGNIIIFDREVIVGGMTKWIENSNGFAYSDADTIIVYDSRIPGSEEAAYKAVNEPQITAHEVEGLCICCLNEKELSRDYSNTIIEHSTVSGYKAIDVFGNINYVSEPCMRMGKNSAVNRAEVVNGTQIVEKRWTFISCYYARNLRLSDDKTRYEQKFGIDTTYEGDLIRIAKSKTLIPETNDQYNDFNDSRNNLLTLVDAGYSVDKNGIIFVGDRDENDPLHLSVMNIDSIGLADSKVMLGELTVGSGVHKIKDNGFYRCESLAKVSFGQDLTEIGVSAFEDCYWLNKIDFTKAVNLEKIGTRAFKYAGKLDSIDLGNCEKLSYIGKSAFGEINTVVEIFRLPKSMAEFCSDLINDAEILTIDLSRIEYIEELGGKDEFMNCIVGTVYMPQKIHKFNINFFGGIYKMDYFYMPTDGWDELVGTRYSRVCPRYIVCKNQRNIEQAQELVKYGQWKEATIVTDITDENNEVADFFEEYSDEEE